MRRRAASGQPRRQRVASAADAVAAVLALRGIADQIRAARVLAEWAELVGERIAARTRPDRVADRVLHVEVTSSAWMHELNLLRPQLLANLRARLGAPHVFDDLRLHLAGRDRRTEAPAPPRRRPPAPTSPRPRPPPAVGADAVRIIEEAGAVDDLELRALIARVRITHGR